MPRLDENERRTAWIQFATGALANVPYEDNNPRFTAGFAARVADSLLDELDERDCNSEFWEV